MASQSSSTATSTLAALVNPAALPEALEARAIGIGEILLALQLDPAIVRAGMAVQLAMADASAADALSAQLGTEAAKLVKDVLALPPLEAIGGQAGGALSAAQAENLRKLLLAVIRDGRIIV